MRRLKRFCELIEKRVLSTIEGTPMCRNDGAILRTEACHYTEPMPNVRPGEKIAFSAKAFNVESEPRVRRYGLSGYSFSAALFSALVWVGTGPPNLVSS